MRRRTDRRVVLAGVAIALLACAKGTTEGGGDPPTLTQLTLTPSTATLAQAATQQFTVSGTWSDASATVPTVEFSATGGTITGTGLYTAGNLAGAFRVIARHLASGLVDSTPITISGGAAPPATIFLQESFDQDNFAGRGWYDNLNFTVTTAEHIPGSTRSLAWAWAAGQILPAFGGGARHAITPTDSIYVSYWVKYSANWVGSGVAYHPHEFYILTTASTAFVGPSYTALTTYIEHNYQNGGLPRIGTSDGLNIDIPRVGQNLTAVTESRAVSGCNGNTDGLQTECYTIAGGLYNNGKWLTTAGLVPAFKPTPGPGYKNDWHQVEVIFRMNTVVGGIGLPNGSAEYWFDGTRLINQTGMLFRTGANPTMRWNQFMLGPYIGPGSPVAQTTWIDDLLIANRKP